VFVYRHCVVVIRWNLIWIDCAPVDFVCLCFGIVWLWVEGIKFGVSVQQVALCVCISALCGYEWWELNLEWLYSRLFVVCVCESVCVVC